MSTPTASLYALRLAQITPEDSHDDPYIAALLIALAQSKRRFLGLVQPRPSPDSYCVHVLRTDPTDESYLTLYSADIPSAMLRKLSYSNKPPRMPSNFSVFSKKIPFKPYSSFQERLLQSINPQTSKRQRTWEDVDPRDKMKRQLIPPHEIDVMLADVNGSQPLWSQNPTAEFGEGATLMVQ
ncbi:putative transposase [Colletotrichum sp. SAR 10_66]|nr:putative transposase [Colletotrichum sp. SAR 10_66]